MKVKITKAFLKKFHPCCLGLFSKVLPAMVDTDPEKNIELAIFICKQAPKAKNCDMRSHSYGAGWVYNVVFWGEEGTGRPRRTMNETLGIESYLDPIVQQQYLAMVADHLLTTRRHDKNSKKVAKRRR